MAWLNTANILPKDIKRVWYLDSANGQQVLFDGPVAGTFAYQITSSGYGPTAWFESSQHGVVGEANAYKGDWTYEGFVYMNSAANSLLFNAGGWSGQTAEDKNLLAAIVLRNQKIEVWWETGSNTTVTPSAQSGTMSLTAWHHVAVVKDSIAKTLTFYVDGVASGTATFSANPTGGDTASTGECRMAFGGYLNGWTLPNARIACATFSTTKRDATWMANSYTHLSTDGTLPTDASTWANVGPFLRSDNEKRGVVAVDAAYNSSYLDGYADGAASAPVPDSTPPTIALVSPMPGGIGGAGFPSDWNRARWTPVVVDITDGAPGNRYQCVVARFGSEERVVYRRGAFRGGFAASSSETPIANGKRLYILPVEGWPSREAMASLVIELDAVDGAGNVAA